MKPIVNTILLFIVCSYWGASLHAQTVVRSTDTSAKTKKQQYVKPKGPKAISREVSGGIRLNSNGMSVFANLGRIKSRDPKHSDLFYNVRFWQFELTEKHNPKEYRVPGQSNGKSANKYKYGKINNLYAVKLGRGYMRMLAGKPDPGSVSIHWLYAGGLSVGLLKPYYLQLANGDPNAIKYSEDTKANFLNQGIIQGPSGLGKGIGETKVIPGFHLKSALHFDFSADRKRVIGVETGVNFEYYTQQIQLMANQPTTPYFMDVYVAIQFGKRW